MANTSPKRSEALKQMQIALISVLLALSLQWLIQGLQTLYPLTVAWADIAFAIYLAAISLVLWIVWGRKW